MPTTGKMRPTIAENTGTGIAWSSPSNVLLDDDVRSSATLLDGESTQTLLLTGFPVSEIDENQEITGIFVSLFGYSNGNPNGSSAFIYKAGSAISTPARSGVPGDLAAGPPDTTQTFGLSSFVDTWGLSPENRRGPLPSTFGVGIRYSDETGGVVLNIDAVTMEIFYRQRPPTPYGGTASRSLVPFLARRKKREGANA